MMLLHWPWGVLDYAVYHVSLAQACICYYEESSENGRSRDVFLFFSGMQKRTYAGFSNDCICLEYLEGIF